MLFTKVLLSCVGIYVIIASLKDLLYKNKKTISHYVIIVIYVFNILPVTLDLLFGLPNYSNWMSIINPALENKKISIIYDLYMIFVILCLFLFSKMTKENQSIKNGSIANHRKLLIFAVMLPFIHVIINGQYKPFLEYNTSSVRGLSESFSTINTHLTTLSLLAFSILFFRKSKTIKKKDILILLIYTFLLLWVNGKRFVLVTALVLYLFYFLYSNTYFSKMKAMRYILLLPILIISFFFFYSIYIKGNISFNFKEIYENYRINFGRDDIVKYIMYKEAVLKEPILDYKGQSFLSTVFFFVPRSIWPSKPYPHFRYLTSSLTGESIKSLHFGMTPSLFDMMIANFGLFFGMFSSLIVLIFFVKKGDQETNLTIKATYLMIIIVLLTQNIDVGLVYIIILVLYRFYEMVTKQPQRVKLKENI